MKIGVIVDCLKLPLFEGIKKAGEIGADGIQIYAIDGFVTPENLDKEKRREFKKYISDCGLEVSALCGDFGGHGFQIAADNAERVEKSKRILELALDLDCNIITTHFGIIPEDEKDPIYKAIYDATIQLDLIGKDMGGYFAIETGCETTSALAKHLKNCNCRNVAVNYDPANLIMVHGEDPVEGLDNLKEYIVHTHAKDGVRYKPVDPKYVYGYPGLKGMSHEDIFEMVSSGEYFKEVPIGSGSVDFDKYITRLNEIGYTGYLTIEREVNNNPVEDIAKAIEYLKNKF